MFIYRDEYYLQQRMPKQIAFDNDDKFHDAMTKWQSDMESVHNKAEVLIAKQRHGPTGVVHLLFESDLHPLRRPRYGAWRSSVAEFQSSRRRPSPPPGPPAKVYYRGGPGGGEGRRRLD